MSSETHHRRTQLLPPLDIAGRGNVRRPLPSRSPPLRCVWPHTAPSGTSALHPALCTGGHCDEKNVNACKDQQASTEHQNVSILPTPSNDHKMWLLVCFRGHFVFQPLLKLGPVLGWTPRLLSNVEVRTHRTARSNNGRRNPC